MLHVEIAFDPDRAPGAPPVWSGAAGPQREFQRVTLGRRPLRCGRGADCDLRSTEKQVSSIHALIWCDGGRVWIDDMWSRNGTFVNDVALRGPRTITAEDRVRFGLQTLVRLVGRDAAPTGGGLRLVGPNGETPVVADRTILGAEGRLLVVGDQVAVGTAGEQRWIDVDAEIYVDGVPWRVETAPKSAPINTTRWPYELELQLAGPDNSHAQLTDPSSGRSCRWTAPEILPTLYQLARQRRMQPDEGWVPDREVASILAGQAKPWRVVVSELWTRVRRDILTVGMDPWFIEERPRASRFRLDRIRIR
jgi:pSer/pThr/pTyr-binding forkhead associated (FHA) protein